MKNETLEILLFLIWTAACVGMIFLIFDIFTR